MVLFSPGSRVLAAAQYMTSGITVWDVSTGRHLYSLRLNATPKDFKVKSNNDNAQSVSTLVADMNGYNTASGSLAFSGDSRLIAGPELDAATATYRIKVWNVKTGKEVHTLAGHSGSIRSIALAPDGNTLASGGWDGTVKLWSTVTGKELATIVSISKPDKVLFKPDWIIFTPDGRFDTNTNLEDVKSVNLVIPDDIANPLPLDVFMRDYYEPKLLQRILAGEKFKPIRDITKLNRTQPEVKIEEIEPDGKNTVQVTVEVNNVVSRKQRDARGQPLQSGVCDVRLFRDGQVVAYSTTDEALQNYITKSGKLRNSQKPDEQELELWQRANVVQVDAAGKAKLTFHGIKLPRGLEAKELDFSAYAFNSDRIKSKTDHLSFNLPTGTPAGKGRAYIITVGVNAYQNQSFDLKFSVNDAKAIQKTIPGKLALTGDYSDIVQVSLISDYNDDKTELIENGATKSNLKAVLDLLAGRPVNAETKSRIPNADKLQQVQPEDVVLISFSGHGYADVSGNFFFVLHDTGPGTQREVTDELLSHSLSSEELSLWLRDIDAGEMIMIVDACHSAAAVQGQEFKPGPMGSRGLGQLSYDKGMRILTATQAEDIALGAGAIRQGLLTYALIKEGIESDEADFSPKDNSITVSEWLQYGKYRVPRLCEEIMKGEKESDQKDLVQRRAEELRTQRPSLFDFSRKRRDSLIAKW